MPGKDNSPDYVTLANGYLDRFEKLKKQNPLDESGFIYLHYARKNIAKAEENDVHAGEPKLRLQRFYSKYV